MARKPARSRSENLRIIREARQAGFYQRSTRSPNLSRLKTSTLDRKAGSLMRLMQVGAPPVKGERALRGHGKIREFVRELVRGRERQRELEQTVDLGGDVTSINWESPRDLLDDLVPELPEDIEVYT